MNDLVRCSIFGFSMESNSLGYGPEKVSMKKEEKMRTFHQIIHLFFQLLIKPTCFTN